MANLGNYLFRGYISFFVVFYVAFVVYTIFIGIAAKVGYFDDVIFIDVRCGSQCNSDYGQQRCWRTDQVCVTFNGSQVCENRNIYSGCYEKYNYLRLKEIDKDATFILICVNVSFSVLFFLMVAFQNAKCFQKNYKYGNLSVVLRWAKMLSCAVAFPVSTVFFCFIDGGIFSKENYFLTSDFGYHNQNGFSGAMTGRPGQLKPNLFIVCITCGVVFNSLWMIHMFIGFPIKNGWMADAIALAPHMCDYEFCAARDGVTCDCDPESGLFACPCCASITNDETPSYSRSNPLRSIETRISANSPDEEEIHAHETITGRSPDADTASPPVIVERAKIQIIIPKIQDDESADIKKIPDDFRCVACKSNFKCMIAMPCSHLLFCEECCKKTIEKEMEKCAVCREKVEHYRRIYA